MSVQTESNVVVLNKLNIIKAPVILIGDSPILMHKWSDKAKKEMLDKQMGKNTKQRGKKNPEQDYKESMHKCSDGPTKYGFPANGVKACACRGAKEVAGLDMTKARTSFHVLGELVPIYGSPEMHESMVRIAQTTDIRYRGIFNEWATRFTVRFNADIITYDQIVNIFEYGGFGCGIGEWRPARNGTMGMFHVGTEEELTYYINKYGEKE